MEQINVLSTIAAIHLFQTEAKGVIISGGYGGKSLKIAELLDLKTFKRCQLPELATNRHGHTQVGNRTIGHVHTWLHTKVGLQQVSNTQGLRLLN